MKHVLPVLPYDASALEPHVDGRTMHLHHDMHHAAYVRGLNVALQSAPVALKAKTADWLLRNLDQVPAALRATIGNNAGGHVNHSLLWRAMSPEGGTPSGALAGAIDDAFGNYREFRVRFEEAGARLFGSGWVWLVAPAAGAGKLEVLTTSGHANPVSEGRFPILVNDVWEHAYYLKHENRRPEYLARWWPVVNWSEAARRFERSRDVAVPVRSRTDGSVAGVHAAALHNP